MIGLEPEFHIEDSHIGGRSPATCRWKCGDACAQPILNPSQNTYMRDVVEEALTRRSFLAASMAGLFVMSGVANISKAQAAGTLGFKPIGLSSEDRILLADGYTHNVVIRCGEPSDPSTFFAGFPKDKVSAVSCPDNITFDRAGNMWIATDGMGESLKKNDGVFAVPTRGPERGQVMQFMSSTVGSEVCGPTFTPDNRNFFAGIQHPGEGGTVEKPLSLWPDGSGVPRPSVIAVRKNDGGLIGG